jgi:hypothetical protein
MIIWKRPSLSLITLQDTPNMEKFALSQGWVRYESKTKKRQNKKNVVEAKKT